MSIAIGYGLLRHRNLARLLVMLLCVLCLFGTVLPVLLITAPDRFEGMGSDLVLDGKPLISLAIVAAFAAFQVWQLWLVARRVCQFDGDYVYYS